MRNPIFNLVLLTIFSFAGSSAQASNVAANVVVSSCTFTGSTLGISATESGSVTVGEFFQGEIPMNRTSTNPAKFFAESSLSPSSSQLKITGEFLDQKFVLKVLVTDGNRVQVRENRSAALPAGLRPRRYRAHFASPIVNEIMKYNPEMGSATWSSRFPKNEMVINNLEIACLVGPPPKPRFHWFW